MCGKSLSCGGGFSFLGMEPGGTPWRKGGREPKGALWKTGSLDLGFRMEKL